MVYPNVENPNVENAVFDIIQAGVELGNIKRNRIMHEKNMQVKN